MGRRDAFVGEKVLWIVLAGTLVIGLAVFSLHTLQALQARVPLDYGEGPLLNQAQLLAKGQCIYRPDLSDYPYTVANYPPLYPLAVSFVGRLLGFNYATGRFVSAGATLACGIALALIVLRTTGDRVAAAATGALFLSFPYTIFWGSLGRVDMLALALSLWGIWSALRWPDSLPGLGLSLLLLLAAIFTRQSYLLAAPLAVTVHLATRNRSRALLFAVALGLGVLIVGGILQWRTDGGFLFHVVTANANAFSVCRAISEAARTYLTSIPLVVLVLWEFLHYARRPTDMPWFTPAYLLGGVLSGLTVGKVGSHVNYMLELLAAMSIWGGLALARWRREASFPMRSLLLLTLALQVPWSLFSGRVYLLQCGARRAVEPEVRQLESIVCSTPDPVLADEMMGLLVVCGREILFQPFEFTQLAQEGKWDQGRFVADIRAGKFALILVTEGVAVVEERWTSEMWAAIQERYEPVVVLASTVVYRPRISEEGP